MTTVHEKILSLEQELDYRKIAMQKARDCLLRNDTEGAWNALYELSKGDLLGQAAAGVVEREKRREKDLPDSPQIRKSIIDDLSEETD